MTLNHFKVNSLRKKEADEGNHRSRQVSKSRRESLAYVFQIYYS